ncbi:MAG: tRNA lysidine(34) synthetase TilS [Candidatus Sulfotelmatobacter sp.]
MHQLAECVLGHIRREELLRAGDRIGVAVSGGIDSVALLRLLLELCSELGIVLSVVHFNHKLRAAESDADQQFVEGLARGLGLEFHSESGDVVQHAADEHSGVEAAARELRYGFFQSLLGSNDGSETEPDSSSAHLLDKIATGHTLDDQAETVLMRLIRGTGPKGLGGIYPRIVVENEDGEGYGEIIRPLLEIRRRELEQYLADIKQPWREDSTNTDSKFTRNRVRRLVLPLLEREFNPSVVEGFAELAEIARDEEDYWENEISGWLGTVVQWSQPEWTRGLPGFGDSQSLVQIQSPQLPDPKLLQRLGEPGPAVMNASVSRPWLLTEPRAVQRRVLKAIGQQAGIPLEFKHIEDILRFAAEDGPSGKELSLPLGWRIVREPEAIAFVTPDLRRNERVPDYEYTLPVPGRVFVGELGLVIAALHVGPELQIAEYNPQQLLRAELLRKQLTVRNWRPGDRFWPAHTKSSKKVKELLQEQHVSQPERRLWPVIVNGDEIVWMRGFPVPASWHAKREQEAILIREMRWAPDEYKV